jgi:short-subunit dehydrogenase involved in D-alanine esterification of teichoic acids
VDFFLHDVAEESHWENLMQYTENKYGRLDGIVNNAGIAIMEDIESTTYAVRLLLLLSIVCRKD